MTDTPVLTYLDGKITIHPDICNGKPTLRGTRITAQTILEFLTPVGCATSFRRARGIMLSLVTKL